MCSATDRIAPMGVGATDVAGCPAASVGELDAVCYRFHPGAGRAQWRPAVRTTGYLAEQEHGAAEGPLIGIGIERAHCIDPVFAVQIQHVGCAVHGWNMTEFSNTL